MASRTLQSTIEISGVLSPSLQAAIKNAVGKLDEMSKETLAAVGAAEKLSAEISTQESVLKSLQKGYADYIVSGKEGSDEARTLADKIQELSEELDENRGTLRSAEKAAKSLGETMEDAGEQAEKSSDGYTVMKDVIADLAADAIRSAVEAFKELALEGDSALAKLEARTGSSADKMANLEDVMREVYNANYGESLDDVAETLSTVIQMTDDLDNASLAKVTKSAIALEDVFGYDTTESMRAVNSLMDQFGITADEAFNLIVQGAQKGLDQNGDLLDTINEYSVQFKGAGYTADDMFNMLLNGAETGTWSVDKLGDAVKEFNIRMSDGTASEYLEDLGVDAESVMEQFNKGGPEAQKAIGSVMKAIMDCDDATLQYQTGVGIFGTMWEDLGAETVAALMETEGAISSTNNAMAQMDAAAYDTLEATLGRLAREYKGVGSAVAVTGGSLLYTAANWGTITAKAATAKATFAKAGTAIKAAIGGISASVLAVVAAVAILAVAFVSLWKNNEDFRNKIVGIWEEIKGKFVEFGQGIVDRLNALGFDFENFGDVIRSIWDGFCSVLAPIFEGVFLQVSNILGVCLDVLMGLFDFFVGLFTGDWEQCWLGIQEIFAGCWDFILATFQNWGESLRAVADVVLGWFGTNWSQCWGNIKENFFNTWNSIRSTASSVWSGIKSTASIAWSGIKNAITSPITSAWNIVSGVVEKLKNAFNFKWSLPKLKLPHISVSGGKAPYGIAGKGSLPKFSIEWYKDGGIMTSPTVFGINPATGSLMAGGEAGAEAVLPLSVLWDKLELVLRRILNGQSSTGGTPDEGLTSKAGELLTLDDFSLGSLSDGTSVVIYYDFSGFTWSPQIHMDGTGDENEADFMARLKAHEAEFFDWLEEFIQMREAAQYA